MALRNLDQLSWASNGATIPGATSATYMPTISDAGRKLTVTATGSKSGHYPASKTSNQTASVSGGATSTRLAGSTRYDTSALISQGGFAPGVEVVYVASGVKFPDALSAAPAASLYGGPLLLTKPDVLSAEVDQEIRRLAPSRIVVVGGTASVTDAVITQLEAIAPTTRVAGVDRYAASRAIVEDAFDSVSVAYIATGLNFPDALTASAAAAHLNAPVILIKGDQSTLDPYTVPLLRSLGVTSVQIVGGTASVSANIQTVFSNAGFSVNRMAGANRYEVANTINTQVFGSAPTVYLASGITFPDALAGAALAGSKGAPLFLSQTACIPASVSKTMTAMGTSQVVLLGGTATLTPAVAGFQRC